MIADGLCSREGCARKGEWYLVICVPALGATDKLHPLRMMIDLPLCRDHVEQADPQDWLLPESRKRLRIALMARGRAVPDFKRVWKERGRIGDEHWRAFEAARGCDPTPHDTIADSDGDDGA